MSPEPARGEGRDRTSPRRTNGSADRLPAPPTIGRQQSADGRDTGKAEARANCASDASAEAGPRRCPQPPRRTPTAKAFPRLDDDYKQEPGQESLCSSVRMRDPTAGRAIASRTAIVERRPVQDPIRSWTLCPTPRSLGGLSGYSTKPAGKEQAKTHEESAECLPKRQGGGSATPHAAGKPSAERASQNARYRDAASFKQNTTGYTPNQKKNLNKTNRNTTDKTDHTHPLRPRKGPGGCTNIPKNPSADQQHAPIGLRAHVIPAKAGIQKCEERAHPEGMGESPLACVRGLGGCTYSRKPPADRPRTSLPPL